MLIAYLHINQEDTLSKVAKKGVDTVGQPPSTKISVPNMPSWKAKKLRKLPQEKVLLEL
jgi:hypothetical protein